jgi:hypothetical protein
MKVEKNNRKGKHFFNLNGMNFTKGELPPLFRGNKIPPSAQRIRRTHPPDNASPPAGEIAILRAGHFYAL